MPIFPQSPTALLVPGGNVTAQTGSTYTANPGDIVAYTPTANSTVLLPAVATGSQVAVVNLAGTYTITVKAATADQATVKVQGAAGGTGYVVPAGGTGASASHATFTAGSDGNWYVLS